ADLQVRVLARLLLWRWVFDGITGVSPNADFEVQMRTDGSITSTNNRGIFLNADSSFFISGVYFNGQINSPFPQSVFASGGPLPNPTEFLSAYYGTYNVTSTATGQVDAWNGSSLVAKFTATSLSIFAAPQTQPVPEPTSMAIFGLCALGLAYRARRKSKV
ncbi:MAG: PEP-CTERM sorting domain-containing protein, partial [Pirellula sp.]